MFMYLAWQSVHAPLMAPQARIDALAERAPDPHRSIFAAMVSELDDGVGPSLLRSTRVLGRRTAPFAPFLIPYRVPHGFTPRS